jgi:alkylation response protein AidB-like acyl-CoA dehydrogenase
MADSAREPQLADLYAQLAQAADGLDTASGWPAEQLAACGRAGVFRWFIPREFGGTEWSGVELVHGYLDLAASCLATAFIITQRTGACRRIASSQNETLRKELLPGLASGELMASVGISHLTTSRRHLQPVLTARETPGGFVLDGYSPWVTGGPHCDWIVLGATLADGRQLLAAVPGDAPGLTCHSPEKLVGLSASHTGRVELQGVEVGERWLLEGPVENVMSRGAGGGTGGLDTSTLAAGLAHAAVSFLEQECSRRDVLAAPTQALRREQQELVAALVDLAGGGTRCSSEQVRTDANSLALRSTQAALTAAKGAGYVTGHPAGRWCREALFFLVWSCPPPVAAANLCELAGLDG